MGQELGLSRHLIERVSWCREVACQDFCQRNRQESCYSAAWNEINGGEESVFRWFEEED